MGKPARRFRFIDLGAFVVMPDHFHGIVIIHPPVGATRTRQWPGFLPMSIRRIM